MSKQHTYLLAGQALADGAGLLGAQILGPELHVVAHQSVLQLWDKARPGLHGTCSELVRWAPRAKSIAQTLT